MEAELSGHPEIDASTIDALRDKEQEVVRLETQLKALSATIEIVNAPGELRLDGVPILQGVPTPLPAAATIVGADGLELKLIVPGVADAERVSAQLAAAQSSISQTLSTIVIGKQVATSVQQLSDSFSMRKVLAASLAAEKKRLKEAQPEQQAAALSQSHLALEKAKDINDALPEYPGYVPAADLPAANQIAESIAREYGELEQKIQSAEDYLEQQEERAVAAVANQSAFAKTRRQDEDALRDQLTLRQNLLKDYSDDESSFLQALSELEVKEAKAERDVATKRNELKEADLELLEMKLRRLTEKLKTLEIKEDTAKGNVNFNKGQLKPDGTSDPFTSLTEAEEALSTAEEDYARLQLEAAANQLLHQLFQDELNAANARITEPLAAGVEHYLRHLYGSDTKVGLTYNDGKFGEFELIRPQMASFAEPFSSLSGGAREQVAAAVRLATARILAEDYGGNYRWFLTTLLSILIRSGSSVSSTCSSTQLLTDYK